MGGGSGTAREARGAVRVTVADSRGAVGGTTRAGGLYVAFMTRDAEVESAALVSPEDLDARRANGFFGSSCAGLGDLNEDGVPDVAVGACVGSPPPPRPHPHHPHPVQACPSAETTTLAARC